jgi:hypothetical protein
MEEGELIDISYLETTLSKLKSNCDIDTRVECIVNMLFIMERLAGKYGIRR